MQNHVRNPQVTVNLLETGGRALAVEEDMTLLKSLVQRRRFEGVLAEARASLPRSHY